MKSKELPVLVSHAVRYAWATLQESLPLQNFVADAIAEHIPFQRAATRGAALHILLGEKQDNLDMKDLSL